MKNKIINKIKEITLDYIWFLRSNDFFDIIATHVLYSLLFALILFALLAIIIKTYGIVLLIIPAIYLIYKLISKNLDRLEKWARNEKQEKRAKKII
jgi:hypothetical protein